MHAVVGCSDCQTLWILEDPRGQDSATCPQCGRQHQVSKLRTLYRADDADEARQARATMLARRQGEGEAFANVPDGPDLERAAMEAGMDDEEFLAASGLDPEAVSEAGERAGDGSSGSGDRASVVRAAVREQDDPTEADVVAYAGERGVPEDAARTLLQRLVRRGEATRAGGTYRLV